MSEKTLQERGTADLDLHKRCQLQLAATKTVLADREAELLKLKGPCSIPTCRLHFAHSGPCDIRADSVWPPSSSGPGRTSGSENEAP